jgi:glycosyltransferase involved in cell wall biosynthesis
MHWIAVILVFPYFFLILKIYRSLIKIETYKVSGNPGTLISVIIPCKNEQISLPHLLEDIALQDYPKELFEVIIVDDNSYDKTYETASSFPGIRNLITIYNNGIGKKQAIRCGINISSGELIITTDADCSVGKSWIRTIAAYYEQYKPDMIICPVKFEPGQGFFGKLQELEFLSLQAITAGTAFMRKAVMCNGANLSFTRKVYRDHSDDLHEEIASGDDIFLLHSLKKNKKSDILWLESSEASVMTAACPTLMSFLKQRSRWISKGRVYSDRFTIILGIVTFVTIVLQISIFAAMFFNRLFISVFLIISLIKSIPDFIMLLNTTKRYGRKELMKLFLAAQIIYPFYVMSVFLCSLLLFNRKNINSPSPKET